MRIANEFERLNSGTLPNRKKRRQKISSPINWENGSLFKGRQKERTCCMRLMMTYEMDFLLVAKLSTEMNNLFLEIEIHPSLSYESLVRPGKIPHKMSDPSHKIEAGPERKCNVINFVDTDMRIIQAKPYCIIGKILGMFFSHKPFFFSESY